VRGFVLRYLGAVATGATRPQARGRVPLPFRPLAVRSASKHVLAAGFDTQHAEDDAHVFRLAYLRAAGKPAPSDDPAAVATAFEAARDLRAERRAAIGPSVTLLALLLVAGAAGGGIWWWRAQRRQTFVEADPTAEPAPTLEELLGMEDEEPRHALYDVFRTQLAEYVVALDSRSLGRERMPPRDVATTRAAVLERFEDRAPELVEPTTGLFDAAELFVAAPEDDTDDQGIFLNQLVRFQDALRAQDVPFFVDAELRLYPRTGRQRVLLSMFTVEARRTFAAGDARIHQLDLQRLDNLNYERSLLGYTRPEVRYALVRIDRIERFLVRKVLPSIHAPNESVIVRDYQDESGIEWVTTFEEHASEDLREEARALTAAELGPTSTALRELAAAIVQRRNGVRAVSHSLRGEGRRLREPRAYVYDVSNLAAYGDRIDANAHAEVRSAERALRGEAALSAYRVLADAFTLSIAEHEVQHRLDYEADRMHRVPDVLGQYVGETESEDRVNRRAERSNAELSAYLSQIAQRPSLSRTSLVHVASFVMDRNGWRMPEAYAAVALFEALAETLDFDHERLIVDRRIQRSQIAAIYARVRQLGGRGLSELAGRTWTRIYGAPLPDIERVDGD